MGMYFKHILMALFVALLAGCDQQGSSADKEVRAPYVRMATLKSADENTLMLSGIVQARHETPIAFQVDGRIIKRHADAGQSVAQGQTLFNMDQRDLKQSVQAAKANVLAAEAAVATAQADAARMKAMQAENLVSVRALDRSTLKVREAITRKDATKAKYAQALNGLSYTQLTAPVAGVLLEVTGEAGQVVQAGQSVAVLAHDGEREVELFFPDLIRPPQFGSLLYTPGRLVDLTLREVSGAVDPESRTWRARYSVLQEGQRLALGSVVRAKFIIPGDDVQTFVIPITALDERGQGAVLWRVINGEAQAINIKVVSITAESAKVQGNLKIGEKVIALGTHLLMPNMAVKALIK
ncbi:hypothetical protein A9Q99_13950 [Gammaproteobacteria bacterium 45_16_T64]|nr:hypothetical protein A9Q99_13950 [Gammaproteobacteria bacterium 45_16_T64]